MKAKITTEVDIKILRVDIPVRYGTEDIPADFPFRDGDNWRADVDIDSGVILEWPKGQKGYMHMKVCDEGSYFLLDSNKDVVLKIVQNYVPNNLIPGKWGDYVCLDIDSDGKITNWLENPTLEDFYTED